LPARAALTLFHVRGIRIGVDYSWFVVLFFIILWLSGFYESVLGEGSSSGSAYALAVLSALAFFGSILLHELGHAVVAMRNGIGITEITLWLFGGVAHMARDTDSAGAEFRIAVAGPLVTLAIAITSVAVGIGLAGSEQGFLDAMLVEDGAEVSGGLAVLGWIATLNILVLFFNLIPAFPLDGGRIARAAAWKLTGDRNRATRFAAGVGQGFSYLFMGIGIALVFVPGAAFTGIWLAVIGFLLGSAARGASRQTRITSRIDGLSVSDVMDPEPVAIPDDTTVERALDEFFLRYRWPWFPVTDAARRFRGMLAREAAESVPDADRSSRRVDEVFEPDSGESLQVRGDAPLSSLIGNDALRRLGALAAVDGEGHLLGIVTADQIGRALRDALAAERPGGEAPPSV
jgi:Zn-dependent protease